MVVGGFHPIQVQSWFKVVKTPTLFEPINVCRLFDTYTISNNHISGVLNQKNDNEVMTDFDEL